MAEQETVVDVIVMQDGENPAFKAYMPHSSALTIQENGGLSHATSINLRETPDRPIPNSIKDGTSCITDVLVRLEPNINFSLN
jgi:hypothetical protein